MKMVDRQTKDSIILSIIVPIYNVEKYVEKCLESLTSQDLSVDKYEIICVNDGSTDNSAKIAKSFADRFHNIRIVHQDNSGVSAARNTGIDLVKGKYIWFVDSDDFIKCNVLAKIADRLVNSNCDRLTILPYAFVDQEESFIPEEVSDEMSSVTYMNYLWTQIIKAQLIVDNQVYFDTYMTFVEDAVFMTQLYHLFQNTIHLNEVVYFYRKRNNSLVSQNLYKRLQCRIRAAEICDEIMQEKRMGDVHTATEFKYICVTQIMKNLFYLNKEEKALILSHLKEKRLFPLRFSTEFTPNSRKNAKSKKMKCLHWLSDYSYLRIGYYGLNTIQRLNEKLKV